MRKVLFVLPALAMACAQVSSSEYVKEHGFYGESNGFFQRIDTKGFDLHINGKRHGSFGKACYEDFTEYQDGDMFCEQIDGTACQGAAGAPNYLVFPSGNRFAQDSIVAQTIVGGADMDAGSLDIAGDQTNNDGLEIYSGIHGTCGSPFIVNHDDAFYFCAKVAVEDVSGTDDMHIGFRAAGLMNATFDDYTDLVSIGPMSGNVTIETIVGGAATTTTDTTLNLADGGTDTYCVYVSSAGVVTYTVDGDTPPTTAALTLADSLELIPFIHVLQDSDLSGEIDLLEWEVGYGTQN
jgi:hypothetical protein